jgi:hypothetical protein
MDSRNPDKSLDQLLDDYLAGNTGKLVDPATTAAGTPDPREGKLVTITGLAERAMEGAVVIEEGGAAVYVAGLDNWPAELYRHQVEVTGTLGRRSGHGVPGTAADGGARHGSSGSSRVITGATWKLAE